MFGELMHFGRLFAASAQAASLIKPLQPCGHHRMAAFYDGGPIPAKAQEQPSSLEKAKPSTHSEAVMAELKRLGDVFRGLHIIHSDTPAKEVANEESTTTTSPESEEQREPFYSFSHDHVANEEPILTVKLDAEPVQDRTTPEAAVENEQLSDIDVSDPLKQDLKVKRSAQVVPCCKQDPVPGGGQCDGIGYVGAHFCEYGFYCEYRDPTYSFCAPNAGPGPGPQPGTVPVYGQCSGQGYVGPHTCEDGSYCRYQDPSYSQCVPLPTPPGYVPQYGQCGGANYDGLTMCTEGTTCVFQNPYYSQCL